MPYTNALAADYGVATASYGTAHPSLPNYLEMISGSTQGVTADVSPPSPLFTGTTLAGQLSAAGYSTQAYAEDLPADPTADSGTYVVHHDPWEYFAGTPAVAPATALLGALDGAAAPDFVWFTPDAVDDGDLTAPQATILADEDAFLSSFIPSVEATPWYAAGGQIVIEWDEALDSDTSGIAGGAGGHALTIVVSSAMHGHPVQDAAPVATAGILHSIEKVYGLPYLGDAANPAEGNIDPLL
jgi:acid phosphatase